VSGSFVDQMVKGRGLPLACRFDPGTHLTDEAERTLDLPKHGAARACAPGCQQRLLLSPFEEEEEGTGVPSDVVKVKGEDPATTGPLI